jgi:hypothetical protein
MLLIAIAAVIMSVMLYVDFGTIFKTLTFWHKAAKPLVVCDKETPPQAHDSSQDDVTLGDPSQVIKETVSCATPLVSCLPTPPGTPDSVEFHCPGIQNPPP